MVKEVKEKEGEYYWCLMDCEKQMPYYFDSESKAKRHAKELKLTDFIIGLENG